VTTEGLPSRHHPSWREVRDSFLADPAVQQAYTDLAPRFAVVRQLIALREQLEWTQRDLADRAGMKQPQLARLETVQMEPRLDTLQRLAAALNGNLHETFRRLMDRSPPPVVPDQPPRSRPRLASAQVPAMAEPARPTLWPTGPLVRAQSTSTRAADPQISC
jgi:transcriptional regulator with XRE-family HTH domain